MIAGLCVEARAVPLPKPRPIPRNAVSGTSSTSSATTNVKPAAPGATPVQPAARATPAAKPAVPLARASTSSTPQADADALEQVIDLVRNKKPTEATQLAASIGDPVARKLAEWIILRSDNNSAIAERYKAFITDNPSWPGQSFLRRRGEAALWDDKRDDTDVLTFFGSDQPLSAKGKFILARALLARGDRKNAERLVRDAWRSGDSMSSAVEDAALDQFGALLTGGDYKARMDALLYGNDSEGALRSAQRLGGGQLALAKARIAVNKKASNAKAMLDAVPRELQGDPVYILTKIQWLRRDENFTEAAQAMIAAPRDPARLVNLDEWWIERRLLARKMLDNDDANAAYVIARDSALPARDIYKTEQEFTAGWIALRFLNDPNLAAQHFARIGVDSVNPTALARAGYWQGRAAEAAGRGQDARTAYEAAAMQSTSYYGQLARAKLRLPSLQLHEPPRSRGGEKLEIVRAVELLYSLDEQELAVPILGEMGERADPDALAALCEAAERNNDPRGMLLVGKAALNRGLPFDFYAYPLTGIPLYKNIGPEVEKPIVFAIARQESAFNPTVVSPANAYGLMQVTPDAGKYVTKKYGATFDLSKLKNDPSYNATLGAAELGGLIDDYRGSYIMTFAAYNAGRGSVRKWVERYGDPRDPKVDAIDWVEQIPFAETRNYVQRVMENLQVYRARFGGSSKLLIEADLRRGAGVE